MLWARSSSMPRRVRSLAPSYQWPSVCGQRVFSAATVPVAKSLGDRVVAVSTTCTAMSAKRLSTVPAGLAPSASTVSTPVGATPSLISPSAWQVP